MKLAADFAFLIVSSYEFYRRIKYQLATVAESVFKLVSWVSYFSAQIIIVVLMAHKTSNEVCWLIRAYTSHNNQSKSVHLNRCREKPPPHSCTTKCVWLPTQRSFPRYQKVYFQCETIQAQIQNDFQLMQFSQQLQHRLPTVSGVLFALDLTLFHSVILGFDLDINSISKSLFFTLLFVDCGVLHDLFGDTRAIRFGK